MDPTESWLGVSPDGGILHRPRPDRHQHCGSSRLPTSSVEFAAAVGRHGYSRSADIKSRAPRPTPLFPTALRRRVWNFGQPTARVNLLVGRTLGRRRTISHRNLPSTFKPGCGCLARSGIRWRCLVGRLLSRHRFRSFNFILAATARPGQSPNPMRPRT
jgi:hypothetical protein